jgi:hypothetical protein
LGNLFYKSSDLAHLVGLVGAETTVTIEIDAQAPFASGQLPLANGRLDWLRNTISAAVKESTHLSARSQTLCRKAVLWGLRTDESEAGGSKRFHP